ncbi:GAF domain-containing protein [Sphingomonas echinoides]|jgi:GAF domain-containing protein|uniref:GAF domain-containing protein n=1 Tax=Sphingomonas echinoides TaxID=59803 RepID=UPI002413BDF3|nr:GAF domain-containing protein [Sphingomonas echinoides]
MHNIDDCRVALAANPHVAEILAKVCELTGMGFAAVAHVTDQTWTACHVIDRVEFGLDAGDELDLKTTICNEIRDHGRPVAFDSASNDSDWQMHPTPILYGFESYISLPITLSDGQFFGTICALDPAPAKVDRPEVIATMQRFAKEIAAILESRAP